MTSLSTHVLDTAAGRPASGVPVRLLSAGQEVATGITDEDGRVGALADVVEGIYQLVFGTSAYSTFFPEVTITFVVSDDRHHHVPLLLSPYSYSTYRGS
ncbi:MAG TPA: hydroxyisourate hydrolase [Nocardioidaceae bacterium]|nr:hydroxyisourate hydrolase [Nocardioidaceae bacterium]